LAVELSVNPNTISKAYRELEIKDGLESHQGTGTFIGSASPKISEKERKQKLRGICDEFVTIAGSYGYTHSDLIEELKRR
jgi:GntR family transcriptional regulator